MYLKFYFNDFIIKMFLVDIVMRKMLKNVVFLLKVKFKYN